MFKASLLTALALALASTSAVAHPRSYAGHGSGGMLQHADSDGDGTISRDEYRAAREAAFAKRDHNSDGQLDEADRAEHAAQRRHRAARAAAMRKHLDEDNDGKIGKAEFVEAAMARFDKSDTDGNGVLDEKEVEAARSAMRERMRAMHEKSGKGEKSAN